MKWLAVQHAALLPVEYFHVVFTLPHALNALVRVNPRRLYALQDLPCLSSSVRASQARPIGRSKRQAEIVAALDLAA